MEDWENYILMMAIIIGQNGSKNYEKYKRVIDVLIDNKVDAHRFMKLLEGLDGCGLVITDLDDLLDTLRGNGLKVVEPYDYDVIRRKKKNHE